MKIKAISDKVVYRGMKNVVSKKNNKEYQIAVFMRGVADLEFFVNDKNFVDLKNLKVGDEVNLCIDITNNFLNLLGIDKNG